ncbi:MAG: TIGR02281 family clan AA aspartic protease [Pseudomonas sp.]|uniref:retropepsin-like aspartic protease family protein n=1 Tax=Pseudomonas sp. TaxID=306 RepID=UPI003399AAEB
MRRLNLYCLGLLLIGAVHAQAASSVQVVGLFPGAAVLNVDGQRKLVKVGQTGPGGVQVLSVDKQGALLRVDGAERNYPMSREYSDGFATPEKLQLSIAKGVGGHYWVAGSVNGSSVQFLVDTGATAIAMNESQAARLNIDYRVSGVPTSVSTASGTARAWQIRLDRVKVGAIQVLGVDAVVLEGESPTEALLGMSFLNRVGWRQDQGMLIIESKL